ncbi:helix-turn-helix transcriptional regulator [Raoultibacter massiliensis]|uniref:Helix-turn-helix transcriptional regulator n=1 Tax=Raoultibacter massiliensis TaxID=1852371 RepID=A0ABV1J9X8_9ACTN|nr:helix-turn-helix transcriptional regulator [Raoultibacter massiliensis]
MQLEGSRRVRFSQEFRLETLAFIAFFATLPLYSPNLVLFSEYGAADVLMPFFVNTMMVAAAFVGVVSAWFAFRHDASLFTSPQLVIASSVLYIGGFALFVAGLGIEGFGSEGVMVAAGAAVACGMVPICIAWGTYLAMFDLRQALFYLAIMVGVSSFIALMLSSVAIEPGLVSFGLLALIGVALPCAKATGGKLDRAVADAPNRGDRELGYLIGDAPVAPSDSKSGVQDLLASVRRMASVAALPFIGLLVFAFVMGVRKFMVFDTFYVETLGGIVATVVVLPLSLFKIDRPLMSFVYQVFLPVCAIVLVVLNAFPYGTAAQWLASTLSYVFYGIIGILALASLCAMAHAREFSSPFIYGLTVACFMIASFLGILFGSVSELSENAGPILLVISTAYFGFVVLAPLASSWRRERASELEARRGDGKEAQSELQQRIEATAARFELSPRESETLAYLGRGHGIVFIAKTLVISESTVRTHVKSIYRKLDVSSREELLELIDRG